MAKAQWEAVSNYADDVLVTLHVIRYCEVCNHHFTFAPSKHLFVMHNILDSILASILASIPAFYCMCLKYVLIVK